MDVIFAVPELVTVVGTWGLEQPGDSESSSAMIQLRFLRVLSSLAGEDCEEAADAGQVSCAVVPHHCCLHYL